MILSLYLSIFFFCNFPSFSNVSCIEDDYTKYLNTNTSRYFFCFRTIWLIPKNDVVDSWEFSRQCTWCTGIFPQLYLIHRDFPIAALDAWKFFHCCTAIPIPKMFCWSLKLDLKVQSCKLYKKRCMTASTQSTNTEIFVFVALLALKSLSFV